MPIDQARHDAIYDAKFWEYTTNSNDAPRHTKLGDVMHSVLTQACSVIDIGCGAALSLSRLAELGHTVHGVDASTAALAHAPANVRKLVHHCDLTEWSTRYIKCDAAVCCEVAEHMPPEHAGTLVTLLASVARACILFSAAPPGQGGTDHVNEQPPTYWLEKFGERGWFPDHARTMRLREGMVAGFTAHCEYAGNFFVLRRA